MGFANAYDVPVCENHDPLVDLADYPFMCEPRYFRAGLSDTPRMWARKSIADKLLHLQAQFEGGQNFKIWDAWRPRAVQQNIYNAFRHDLSAQNPDWDAARLDAEMTRYVARADNPARIPPHASAGAIDLTLVDIHGDDLDMGTDFDHFGEEAGIGHFEGKNPAIHENRHMLRAAMESAGFGTYIHEWWHFDFGNQHWAFTKNKPCALYGEVTDPQEFNRISAKETRHVIA